MDFLLAALGHPARLSVVERLLGVDEPNGAPRGATHAELRTRLDINGGTLTKSLQKLRQADIVVESPGPRADQPIYTVRQPEKLLALLHHAAALDAAISDELALTHRLEADLKAKKAESLAKRRSSGRREGVEAGSET
jgi:hypothetical protein